MVCLYLTVQKALIALYHRLTKAGVATPDDGFSWSLQNAKENNLGHLFHILCGHFDETNGVITLPMLSGGRVSCQSQRVSGRYATFIRFVAVVVVVVVAVVVFLFFDILSHHFEKHFKL